MVAITLLKKPVDVVCFLNKVLTNFYLSTSAGNFQRKSFYIILNNNETHPTYSQSAYHFQSLLGLLYPCWPGFWGEVFSLPIKVPIYLPWKD